MTINRLQMYKNFKAKRNRRGKIIKAAPFQQWVVSGKLKQIRTKSQEVKQFSSDFTIGATKDPGRNG